MQLSVVVPALDEADRIAEAVSSAAVGGVEVLVVDGGSRDGTREKARAAGATVVESPPGRARQLRIGIDASGGEAVVLLHADTVLPEGWDGAVRAALADPRVVGGAFRLRFDDRSPALRGIERVAALRARWLRLPYGDQALFVRRDALEEVGGVPQQPFMEDLDLVRELRRCGRLALLPLPVVTSARRYRSEGIAVAVLRHAVALAGWALGVDRARLRDWVRR